METNPFAWSQYNSVWDRNDGYYYNSESYSKQIDSQLTPSKEKERLQQVQELKRTNAYKTIIKALVAGDTDNLPSPTPNPPNDKPDTPPPPPPPDKPKTPVTTKQQDVEFKEEKKDSETQWKHNKQKENANGTVILNAGLIMIPDEVICDPQYLENIRGITYVLKYNNCIIQEPRQPRLPYSFVQFCENYLTDEPPTYASIASDIDKNEGPTYDYLYLMENPPFDRIFPVLEKVVGSLLPREANREHHTFPNTDHQVSPTDSMESNGIIISKETTPHPPHPLNTID
eukprot:447861_1